MSSIERGGQILGILSFVRIAHAMDMTRHLPQACAWKSSQLILSYSA